MMPKNGFRNGKMISKSVGYSIFSRPASFRRVLSVSSVQRPTFSLDIQNDLVLRSGRQKAMPYQRRSIKNASCLISSWTGMPAAKLRGRFDVALAAMTMAVSTRTDLLKMEAAACEHCVYIGWEGVRRNALLEAVYREPDPDYAAPHGAEAVLPALDELGRKYSARLIRDSWDKKTSVAEALRELEANMCVNGVKIKTEWAKGMLKKFTRRGVVTQTTKARKVLITWRVPV
jgi:hypothetical protein